MLSALVGVDSGQEFYDRFVLACDLGKVSTVRTYKIMNRLCPESLWDQFQPRSFHSTYNTRHCKDLQIPRYRTEFAKKGFHRTALTLWNDTPAKFVSYLH